MCRILASLVVCSAIYGFSLGLVHSLKFALRNLVKFPLLLVGTAAVCCIGYYLVARLLARDIRFWEVQRLTVELFRDLALLLASLSPVFLFLAFTLEQPNQDDLGEYPLFLGLNVVCIAVVGAAALIRQAVTLLERHLLWASRSVLVIGCWLALSLLVGSQGAWYLRPFCGVSTIDAPFVLGSEPDYQGATDFFQAVYQLFDPPPLDEGYQRSLGGHGSGGLEGAR